MPRSAGRWRSSPAALLAVAGACASGYDPAFRRDIDRRVAAVSPMAQTFPAPATTTPVPLAVGAWTQYKVVDESGRPSFLTMKLVGEDLGSYWLEIVDESYVGRTLTKMLLYFGDRSNAAAMDIKLLKSRNAAGQVTTEADASRLAEARTRWEPLLAMLVVTRPGLPQEDVTVPAGTFSGCYLREDGPGWILGGATTRVWLHPAVPLTALVRAQATNRPGTMELVAFGAHGAASEIQ
jgi:hypothetical protein